MYFLSHARDAHEQLAFTDFSIAIIDTYVDTGWGDSGGCRSYMQEKLDNAAHTAAQKLAAGLDALLVIYGTAPRDYFAPTTRSARLPPDDRRHAARDRQDAVATTYRQWIAGGAVHVRMLDEVGSA